MSEPVKTCRECGATMRLGAAQVYSDTIVLTCPECGTRHTLQADDHGRIPWGTIHEPNGHTR